MSFGEHLRRLREGAGLTRAGLARRAAVPVSTLRGWEGDRGFPGLAQAQLAEASGVPVGTIRDYEQVKRDPLLSTAFKLAGALGVSVEAFAGCATKEDPAKSRGRPPKQPKPAPALPPAGDLEGQADAGAPATGGAKPKRPRARRRKRG